MKTLLARQLPSVRPHVTHNLANAHVNRGSPASFRGTPLACECRQDPVECILSFICSSNNNIPRITLMLGKLRRAYGELLLRVGEGGLTATGLFDNELVKTLHGDIVLVDVVRSRRLLRVRHT